MKAKERKKAEGEETKAVGMFSVSSLFSSWATQQMAVQHDVRPPANVSAMRSEEHISWLCLFFGCLLAYYMIHML